MNALSTGANSRDIKEAPDGVRNFPQEWQEVIVEIFQGVPEYLVFHPDIGLKQFPCPAGFLVMACKKNSIFIFPHFHIFTFPHSHIFQMSNKQSRECLIKCILKMRVPIENGSGLSTRVSDSIKLSAAYRNSVYKDLQFKSYLISNWPLAVSSSPLNTR